MIHFPLYRLGAALLPLEAISPEARIVLMATAALVHRLDRLCLGWLGQRRTAQRNVRLQASGA